MMGSLKLSIIDEDGGAALASGWTNDQMRKESITTDTNGGFVMKPMQAGQMARRDTIQEIVQSFN